MTVPEFLDRIQKALVAGNPFNLRDIRNQIIKEQKVATTPEERIALLRLHMAVMDSVERNGGVTNIKEFRKARHQEFALLLISEAMIGATDGNIDPDKLLAVTAREVAAGRLSADDELHKLALARHKLGVGKTLKKQFDQTGQRQKTGILSKFRSWFSV